MPNAAKNKSTIELTPLDDLMGAGQDTLVQSAPLKAGAEQVVEIDLNDLHEFKGHPFKVRDDESMQETVESVKKYGVLVPALARPRKEGGYELIAGHRRRHASQLAGKAKMPVIVRNLSDDEATIIMVDSNLQREKILPSERAYAYKMKLEAIRHQGARTDMTSRQVVGKSEEAADLVGKELGISGRKVQRYIRLTHLNPQLLQMVDDDKLKFGPAVELSYLQPQEQERLHWLMQREDKVPSLEQATRYKQFSQRGELTAPVMGAILLRPDWEPKKTQPVAEKKPEKELPDHAAPAGVSPPPPPLSIVNEPPKEPDKSEPVNVSPPHPSDSTTKEQSKTEPLPAAPAPPSVPAPQPVSPPPLSASTEGAKEAPKAELPSIRGELSKQAANVIPMVQDKERALFTVTFTKEELGRFFPANSTNQQVKDTVIKALNLLQRQKAQNRQQAAVR